MSHQLKPQDVKNGMCGFGILFAYFVLYLTVRSLAHQYSADAAEQRANIFCLFEIAFFLLAHVTWDGFTGSTAVTCLTVLAVAGVFLAVTTFTLERQYLRVLGYASVGACAVGGVAWVLNSRRPSED